MQAENESVRVYHGVLGLYSGVLYVERRVGEGVNFELEHHPVFGKDQISLCKKHILSVLQRIYSHKGNNANQPISQSTTNLKQRSKRFPTKR